MTIHNTLGSLLLKRLSGQTLTRTESDELYYAVDALIKSYTRKHYNGRPFSKTRDEDHLDRVVIFWEYLRHIYCAECERGAGWYVSAYRRRFVELETVLELRNMGVHIDMDNVRSVLVNWFAKVRRWGREGIPVDTVPEIVEAGRQEFIRLNNREPNQSTLKTLEDKAAWYVLVNGRKYAVSLDAIPKWMSPL